MSRHATARLFVAVDPPPDVCETLVHWTRDALRAIGVRGSSGSAQRLLGADTLHITLCFLGEQPVRSIERIGGALASISASECELSVGAPLWLPVRRPRVLAVEVHDGEGTLAKVHGEVRRVLEEVCELPDEHGRASSRHRFRPHVTVARMRHGGIPRERALAPTPWLRFAVRTLVLYRSWLSERGASYESLTDVALG